MGYKKQTKNGQMFVKKHLKNWNEVEEATYVGASVQIFIDNGIVFEIRIELWLTIPQHTEADDTAFHHRSLKECHWRLSQYVLTSSSSIQRKIVNTSVRHDVNINRTISLDAGII